MQNDSLIRPIEKCFLGAKKGRFDPPGQIDPKEHTHHRNTFWVHRAKIDASQGKLWTHWRNQKKIKKAREGATSPICATQPPFLAATIFCVCCRNVDIITHARFQVNRFRGFGAPGGRKWPSPIDLAHRPYNSVRTNVLHCENVSVCGLRLRWPSDSCF